MNLSGIELDLDRGRLNPVERDFIDRCVSEDVGDMCVAVDVLTERHSWAFDPRFAKITGSRIDLTTGTLRVGNCAFSAELDLVRRVATFHRDDNRDGSLRLTLRAIATTFLPATGWIPVHAAAVDTGGSALVFCGPSGAGKSTLAATSPFPLLSDEMVAMSARPSRVRGTSFWGDSVCKAPVSTSSVPLRALVILDKALRFNLQRVPPSEAARVLVSTTLTPAAPIVWPLVLNELARLIEDVEVYRMAWWKDEPPWRALRAAGLCGNVEDMKSGPKEGASVLSGIGGAVRGR